MTARPHPAANPSDDFGRMDQRVSSLEAGQNTILSKLDGLSSQLAERGRTPWGLIVSIVGTAVLLVSAIGGLVYGPLVANSQRIEASVAAMTTEFKAEARAVADTYVSRSDFATIMGSYKDRRDDAQRSTEERFKRAELDIDNLQKGVVPRGELEEKWRGQSARDLDLQRQLDELRARDAALYGPRDELNRLSKEVDDLRGRPRQGP